MTDMTDSIRCENSIDAKPAMIYRAFTNATLLRQWLCDLASCDPRPGGRLYLWWGSGYYASGAFTQLEADRLIQFTYQGKDEPCSTEVTISMVPQKGKALVQIEHKGFGSDAGWEKARKNIRRGWEMGLENLASVLRSGEDLRVTRRPMIGVGLSDFSAEIAAQSGIPVTQGIRISSVVPEMGAAKAGLKENDVLVKLAGMPIAIYPDLVNALNEHRAGDTVEVAFYRGGELKQAQMVLSGRAQPPLPESTAEFANLLGQYHTALFAEVSACFEGVSAEEAAHCPTPGEWSAREVLAHLIQSERLSQDWITQLACDQEKWTDEFGENCQAYIQAILSVYPTVEALLEQLRNSMRETEALIRYLPAEFRERKASYWNLAASLLSDPGLHIHEHIAQIQAAITVAREMGG
ncbi:MAG TPA: SRPBCC domain-containing protein [Anaerolineaceae bacterium]|nr:SRPBCC domain-containing protein [Anaerolineaceae bacterium]